MEASHKGNPCIYSEGPSTCQEGECSKCRIHKKHQEVQMTNEENKTGE